MSDQHLRELERAVARGEVPPEQLERARERSGLDPQLDDDYRPKAWLVLTPMQSRGPGKAHAVRNVSASNVRQSVLLTALCGWSRFYRQGGWLRRDLRIRVWGDSTGDCARCRKVLRRWWHTATPEALERMQRQALEAVTR